MSKVRLVAFVAIGLVGVCVVQAAATDVSTKKLIIKDHASDQSKRLIQVQSKDAGVRLADAGDPGTNGASLHIYSATDDFCAILAAGSGWVSKSGKKWKYKNKTTKSSALIQDDKLIVTIKSGITYTLNDDGSQGVVNAQLQFGTGGRYCMRCTGNKKDAALKFTGKDCAAAPCAAEPSICNPPGVTTTSTTSAVTSTVAPTTFVTTTAVIGSTTFTTTTSVPSTLVTTTLVTTTLVSTTVATTTVVPTTDTVVTTSTTSTTMPSGGTVLKGALTATPGRFNYNLTVGLPGANAACNTNFPGTHACTYAELQAAQTAGDLDGLKDIDEMTVTSFWAIDSNQPPLQQCNDDVGGGSGLDWEYGTAHTLSRGQKVALDNALGTLGSLQTSLQCNFSTAWVGCCQ